MPEDKDYPPGNNVDDVIAKFKSHPNIMKIKESVNNEIKFTFIIS